MSYNEVLNLSFEKEVLLTRDQADLAARGITVARITAFAGLRNTFMAVPQDETMVALITVAINSRDAVATSMQIAIREVVGIAKNTFGDGSADYKTFMASDLSRMNAADLSFLSVTIVSRGNVYLAQMAPKGLTAAMLAAITTLKTSLDTKIKDVETAQANQLITTQNRHVIANAFFDEMKAMCDTAQVYYVDRNKLKAEEYVIYDTAGTQQQRNGSVLPEATISRAFDAVTPDMQFKIKAYDGNDLLVYFSNADAGNPGTASVTVINNATDYKVVTATQLGYNGTTGFTHFCIKNSGALETGYRVIAE